MRHRDHEGGYTIIEIIVSLFIISAALLIFQSSINTLGLNKFIKNQDLALRIANSEVELLRANRFSALPATGSFSNAMLSSLPSGAGTLTVTTIDTYTKEVVVTVTWNQQGNHSVVLTTIISQQGL